MGCGGGAQKGGELIVDEIDAKKKKPIIVADVKAFGGRNRYQPGDGDVAPVANTAGGDDDDDDDDDDRPGDELPQAKKKKRRGDEDDEDDDAAPPPAQDADMQRLMAQYASRPNAVAQTSSLLTANKHAQNMRRKEQMASQGGGDGQGAPSGGAEGLQLRHTQQKKVNMRVVLANGDDLDNDDDATGTAATGGAGSGGAGAAASSGGFGGESDLDALQPSGADLDTAVAPRSSDLHRQQQQHQHWSADDDQQHQHRGGGGGGGVGGGNYLDFDQAAASDDNLDNEAGYQHHHQQMQHLPGQMMTSDEEDLLSSSGDNHQQQPRYNGGSGGGKGGGSMFPPILQQQSSAAAQHTSPHDLRSRTTSLGGPGDRSDPGTALVSHSGRGGGGRGADMQMLLQVGAERDEFDF